MASQKIELEVEVIDGQPTTRRVSFRGETWYEMRLVQTSDGHKRDKHELRSLWRSELVLAEYDNSRVTLRNEAGNVKQTCSPRKLFHMRISSYKKSRFTIDGRDYRFATQPFVPDFKLVPLIKGEQGDPLLTFRSVLEGLTARREPEGRLVFKRGQIGTIAVHRPDLFIADSEPRGLFYKPTALLDATIAHWLAFELLVGDPRQQFKDSQQALLDSKERPSRVAIAYTY